MSNIRREILDIFKERGRATVADLAAVLDRPAVSVRHHVDVLLDQGMIRRDGVQHTRSRGRPRHFFVLTENASSFFPSRHEGLARDLLREMKDSLEPEQVTAFFERMADETASGLSLDPQQPIEERLATVTQYLSEKGYLAGWEQNGSSGYLLHVFNCPYEGLQAEHSELCNMDLLLITKMLKMEPQRVEHAAEGDHRCTYLIT